MGWKISRLDVMEAVEDLKRRSLVHLHGEISKLICLASTRDYNTGRYYHDGLAFRFSSEVAETALETCHREVFENLVLTPLKNFVQEVEAFLRSTPDGLPKVLSNWKALEPYRVVIPTGCDHVSREFFFSNMRITLAILNARQGEAPLSSQSASQSQ